MTGLVEKLYRTCDLTDDELAALIGTDNKEAAELLKGVPMKSAGENTAARYICADLSRYPLTAAMTAFTAGYGAATAMPSAIGSRMRRYLPAVRTATVSVSAHLCFRAARTDLSPMTLCAA